MRLAIFDLDDTLIAKDSDILWGEFLAEERLVHPEQYAKRRQSLYADYLRGHYVIDDYIAHSLEPVLALSPSEQKALALHFTQKKIEPYIYPEAMALIESHKGMGDLCLMITATLSYISKPISTLFPVDHHIGTEVHSCAQGGATLQLKGTPAFQSGKVTRLMEWLTSKPYSLRGSHFYSDSYNDLPLLEVVDHPIVTNPDEKIREVARLRGWPILEMRKPTICALS